MRKGNPGKLIYTFDLELGAVKTIRNTYASIIPSKRRPVAGTNKGLEPVLWKKIHFVQCISGPFLTNSSGNEIIFDRGSSGISGVDPAFGTWYSCNNYVKNPFF